jgi:protein TonB
MPIALAVCGWLGTRAYLNRNDPASASKETLYTAKAILPIELRSPDPDWHPELPMIPQQPEPPPPAPELRSMPRVDPDYPLKVGQEFYPKASIRAHEEGRCIVLVTVAADGRVTRESLQESSGFERLDKACLDAVSGGRMLPAMQDGHAVENTEGVAISWKLPPSHR